MIDRSTILKMLEEETTQEEVVEELSLNRALISAKKQELEKLTLRRWHLMKMAYFSHNMTQSEIVNATGLASSTVHYLLNKPFNMTTAEDTNTDSDKVKSFNEKLEEYKSQSDQDITESPDS